MNINQLKYVLKIAECHSMREASSRLYISQPALSSSVHELEEELGFLLFERTNKGVALSKEGRDFVNFAKKAVGQYEILEDRFLTKKDERERFSVSTQHFTFAIEAFTSVIKKFDPQKFVFSIHETKTKAVLDDVRTSKSEVGIVSYSSANKALMKKLFREYGLLFTPLMQRETYIYVWKDHDLAGRKEISIEEMAPYPYVCFDQSVEGSLYLNEEAMADHVFEKMIKSDDRATSMEIIAKLGGYSIGSGMLSRKDATLQGLSAIKLIEEDPLIIGYITRKRSTFSLYGKAYIEELLQYREIE
ncbi:LysR family transcriptional regulator [Dubosiella newyorkensis]|uniref:LysR family transcriptional regulator n=1 Tax=Dubosiella newyorkensis TaxID=1862672 RepID=UPI0023EFB4CE|nr:LysR family transcriptional regulator [Dubosiella newyorkensis]